ncbi:hypothetical protein KI385_02040 [Streptomyces inhibens]|nr:hypothetical protein [Streptomyces inhibens]UKY47733.1 hypothetical protein KI385_02040 [Streptomyces inhibens]
MGKRWAVGAALAAAVALGVGQPSVARTRSTGAAVRTGKADDSAARERQAGRTALREFNVKDHGAAGNGSANDSGADTYDAPAPNANDDALVFKSDYALGAKLPNGHVAVRDSRRSAKCGNALMFGSETCGDFTDCHFDRIAIVGADKSGLGMVSMDGAKIPDVHYRDITMKNVHSPIMRKIGTRPAFGWYLRNVDGITVRDSSVRFAADDGRPAVIAHVAHKLTFDHFTAQRGGKRPYDLGFPRARAVGGAR